MKGSCDIDNKPKGWSAMLKSWYFWKPFVGFSVGAVVGLLYYQYFGCTTTCSLVASNPYSSAIFGGVIGFFIVKRPCSTC
jgi:LytS/YehU family sensor histidine kinase